MNVKQEIQERVETFKGEVEKGGRELRDNGRRLWLAGLGAVSTVSEKSRETWDGLVEKGEARRAKLETRVEEKARKVKEFGREVETRASERFGRALERLGVPSSAQVQDLIERIDQLNLKVEKLARG